MLAHPLHTQYNWKFNGRASNRKFSWLPKILLLLTNLLESLPSKNKWNNENNENLASLVHISPRKIYEISLFGSFVLLLYGEIVGIENRRFSPVLYGVCIAMCTLTIIMDPAEKLNIRTSSQDMEREIKSRKTILLGGFMKGCLGLSDFFTMAYALRCHVSHPSYLSRKTSSCMWIWF